MGSSTRASGPSGGLECSRSRPGTCESPGLVNFSRAPVEIRLGRADIAALLHGPACGLGGTGGLAHVGLADRLAAEKRTEDRVAEGDRGIPRGLARLGLLPVQPLARLADIFLQLRRAWGRTWRAAPRWPGRAPRAIPATAGAGSRAAISPGREYALSSGQDQMVSFRSR